MLMIPPNPFRENRLNSGQDYRPEWDVLELNATISNWLTDEVRRLVGRSEPDPGQMIVVMTGPPGYGKTHLFGRIEHQVGRDVFFVFVPAFEPETPPLDHIRRHVIAALFRKVGDAPSPLELALARLCGPAFADYFADLPPTLAARHDSIRQRLGESPEAVLEVVRSVKTLAPFAKLADSLVSVLPSDAGVVRALALGWAPAPWSDTARKWLQGQDLPEADLRTLGLSDDTPGTMDVLKAIPVLFQHKQPIMICCDQIEGISQSDNRGDLIGHFTQSLMDLLQGLPVQIVLSCFKDTWEGKQGITAGFNAFKAFNMRVRQPFFNLESLKGDQAVRLVAGRMASWSEHPTDKPATWPFDEVDLRKTVVEHLPTPRGLIQVCAHLFDEWCESDRTGKIPPPLVPVGVGPIIIDHGPAFLIEWREEIDEIKSNPERSVSRQSEDQLYRGVLEALKLAQSTQRMRSFGGVRIVDIEDKLMKQTPTSRRPAARVTMAGGQGEPTQNLVVALTTIEAANAFNFYFNALGEVSKSDVGALLIHPRRDLNLGKVAQAFIEKEKKNGRFRLMALEDHPLTYQALEAFVSLLKRAEGQELILNGVTMTPEDCRDLVIKTGVIDNLDLFKMLGQSKKPTAKPEAAAASASNGASSQPTGSLDPKPSGGSVTPQPSGAESQTKVEPPPKPPAADHSAWAGEKLDQAVRKLKLLGQEVQADGFEVGPTFARLRVVPLGRTNFQTVKNKAVDLRISLGLKVVPIVGSQAGCISIDIQRPDRATVSLADALAGAPSSLAGVPSFPVGQDVAGQTHWLNLAEPSDCHLLVAGTTGSGKSEFLRAAVAALASRMGPDRVQFLLIDPKRVTFNLGRPSPYLRAPVAHGIDEALPLIKECMAEMDRRYAILEERKLSNVSELPAELLPRIIVVIDEFAGFLEDKESKKVVNALLRRIGAMARAAGIHLILSTQRPDKDVVTPVLRENLPGRIALSVSSKAGSDLILGSPEAEHLLGKGDLFWKKGGELLRLQSPFVTQADLERLLRVAPG